MSTPQGMKPFNYEEAIKDISKVRTREGERVDRITPQFDSDLFLYGLKVEIKWQGFEHFANGTYRLWQDDPLDLFLLDE